MTIKNRYKKTINFFEKTILSHNKQEVGLYYANPFQFLISSILSAQCTDERVNSVTYDLFKAFPSPKFLALSTFDKVYNYIKSVTYPKNKTKNLIATSKMIMKEFDGEIPSDIKNLTKLPGVGRKTANLISSVIFHIPTIVVDTHVFRVSNRIGLTLNAKTPLQTEKVLAKYVPKKLWIKIHYWLILHGRHVCMARKPSCKNCGLSEFCKYYDKQKP